MIRATAKLVINIHHGEEKCLVMAMNASCQVEILSIHEEAFVEEANLLQCAYTEEHKATGQAGSVHYFVVTRVQKLILVVSLLFL